VLQTPPPESFVVTVAETPADEVTLAEVIFGSFGLVGALVALALLLGAALSLVLVVWHRRHRPEEDHMPSVAPMAATGSSAPRSSQAR
jgi:hypothetical protein